MKKFYLLGGMAVATALIAAATTFPTTFPGQTGEAIYADAAPQADEAYTVPYYSPAASSSAISTGWTVIDANNDNVKWAVNTDSNSPCGTAARMSSWAPSGSTQDDYLISPYIHLEAGQEYAIVYNFRAHSASNVENMTVYLTKGNTLADMQSDDKITLNEHLNYTVTSYKKFAPIFTPTESGDYCVAFWCHSPSYKYYVYVADLLVTKNEFAPNSVSALKATAAAERELKCTLSWTLPTEDVFGNVMPEDKPITAVNVYRDGSNDPIATLDGTATSFEDTDATGLTSGKHTYGVSVVADGVESAKAQVGPTEYVGPIVATAVPVTFDFGAQSDFKMWTIQKGETATDGNNTWTYASSYKQAEYSLKYGTTDDGWLISPPVKVEEPGYYRLSLEICKYNNNFDPKVTLEMATSADIADMQTIGTIAPQHNGSYTVTEWPVSFQDIKIDAAGEYYFAIHNNTTNISGGNTLKVHSLMVEQVSMCPNAVTDLKATPAEDGSLNINVCWVNPTNNTIDESLSNDEYQLEIYLNNAEVPALVVDGGTTEAIIPVEVADAYTVTVKAVGKVGGASAPVSASVKTTWVGPRLVALPYTTMFDEETDGTCGIWEIHNLKADDNHTFEFGKYKYSPYYTYAVLTDTKTYNDYMVSPVFALNPGLYKVSVSHSTGSGSYDVKPVIGVIKKGTFNEEDVNGCFLDSKILTGLNSYNPVEGSFTFMISETGEYQIVYGVNETVSSTYAKVEIRSFSIAAEATFPADVTDLTATVSAEKENTIELTWVNPSKIYDTEYDLPSIESVVIVRDGEIVATLTEGMTLGEPAAYTDEGVTNGVHTYTVYVTLAGNAHPGEHPSVTSDWVGGGLSAPVECYGEFPGWYSPEGENGWVFTPSASTPTNSNWGIHCKKTETQNAHLVTCPLNIEKNTIYSLEFECTGANYPQENDNTISVKMGTGSDHTEFTEVGTIVIPASRTYYTPVFHQLYIAVGSDDEPVAFALMTLDDEEENDEDVNPAAQLYAQAGKVAQAGDNRIALHITQPGGTNIRTFKFTEVAKYDPTSEIVEVGAAEVTFDGQDVNFGGVAAVQVYNLAGVCVANTTAEGSFNVSKLGAGYYIVKVTTDSETVTLKVTVK